MKVQSNSGHVLKATSKEIMDSSLVLSNDRGDELWRWTNDDRGRAQFKVWAVEPAHRRTIGAWQFTRQGASYYAHQKFIGNDFIIPKKYIKRTVKLLGFQFSKTQKPQLPPTQNQIEHRKKFTSMRKAQMSGNAHV